MIFARKMQRLLGGAVAPVVVMGALLTGCTSSEDFVVVPKVALRQISFVADPDANCNSVITVHVVVPKKKELFEEIRKMDSSAYFAAVKQLQQDYPDDLEIFRWEVVPGAHLENQRILLQDFRGQGVLVFMRYADDIPGIHRLILPKQESVRVLLTRNTGVLAY